MSRLVSFGCSYTYGTALPNTQQSWPFILGKLLKMPVANEAKPGSGNLEILWDILNFKFERSDVCFVMWSHFSRDYIFHQSGRHKRIHNNDAKLTKNWLLTHTDYDANIRNWLYIHHADSYLKLKNILVFHLFGGNYKQERFSSPQCIDLKNIVDIEFENFDFGNDNSHPGPESHKILANEIYKSVQGLISHK